MDREHGFVLEREEEVPEINASARIYRHERTGARLLSMLTDDTNKVFGITFRTPPEDSTGVAHILEHSVLCGSRKYPLKEPFVELLKGSLQTFLNAMTYPDKTAYPVASENLKDFYNLVDVYLDAVLHPRITRPIFEQEGWHYELETPAGPLTYKGVVFNEMKGVYSSPEDALGEYGQQSLFPDTTYGVDSGGHPQHIPELTYEQFKRFHEDYYHPSNAYIYFYGDDDPGQRLALLEAYLSEYKARPKDSVPGLQTSFAEPRTEEHSYDPGEEGGDAPKAMFTVNWLLPEITDTERQMDLGLLAFALIGTPASPLRKALIESELGEDLAGSGFADYLRQMYFSTGLRGVKEEDLDEARALVHSTLEQVARDGLHPDLVEAAFNTAEFRLRESNTGGYPRGLIYMITALSHWLHDHDPLAPLRFEAPLARAREKAKVPGFFQGLVRSCFLDNPHRTTIVLRPEEGFSERQEAKERERLSALLEGMDDDARKRVTENAETLKQMQEQPDPPEALAAVPLLQREDLSPKGKQIPSADEELSGVKVLYHDLFTNGIAYVDVGFDLHCLPAPHLPYLGLFGRALLEMGNDKEDYVALSNRIGMKTGGIGTSHLSSPLFDQPGSAAWMLLRGKSTLERGADLMDLFHDVLTRTRFDDRDRFRQILLEEKAGSEAHLIPGGHRVVETRLRAGFSEAGWLSEQVNGVSNLLFLRELADQVEKDWPSVQAVLEDIRRFLVARERMIVNVTTDLDGWKRFAPALTAFLDQVPSTPCERATWPAPAGPLAEGLTMPVQVNYVGKGVSLNDHGYTYHGSAAVAVNYLRGSWLWDRVRVQGGAYGAFCSMDQRTGVFSFGSYRDPNFRNTVEVYDEAGRFLRRAKFDEREMTKNIIGVIGSIDAYQLPDAQGYTALIRHLVHDREERRQRVRDEVLGTEAGQLAEFGEVLAAVGEHGTVVVLGSQESIRRGADLLGPDARFTQVL